MADISCDPKDLLEAAKCYACIPKGAQEEVVIYLLNQLLTTPKTVQELMNGAACYRCIPQGMQAEVQTYLLCQILNETP